VVVWKNLSEGGPKDTQIYPRVILKPPKGFSEGKAEAASKARLEAKNPRVCWD
jgi:hypothetical protein